MREGSRRNRGSQDPRPRENSLGSRALITAAPSLSLTLVLVVIAMRRRLLKGRHGNATDLVIAIDPIDVSANSITLNDDDGGDSLLALIPDGRRDVSRCGPLLCGLRSQCTGVTMRPMLAHLGTPDDCVYGRTCKRPLVKEIRMNDVRARLFTLLLPKCAISARRITHTHIKKMEPHVIQSVRDDAPARIAIMRFAFLTTWLALSLRDEHDTDTASNGTRCYCLCGKQFSFCPARRTHSCYRLTSGRRERPLRLSASLRLLRLRLHFAFCAPVLSVA